MADAIKTVEIAPQIFWVGVEDYQRRLFDAFMELPYGTSYNAYVVKGQARTALVDTTAPGFEQEFLDKVSSVVDLRALDYLVMNHAEPDHASAIPRVMAQAPNARLVLTRKGVDMARAFYHVSEERCMVVKEGDTIDLGGKTLRFAEAPWLHWPETMFTFVVEDRVLLSCDFLAAHLASDRLFDDEVDEKLLPLAKMYFAQIMMVFSKMAAAGLDKAVQLAPRVIAPSHGPVYRNPRRILEAHQKWLKGPLEKKALLIYVSMWGSTQQLAQTIQRAISAEGVEVAPYDLMVANPSHIAADLVDASAIVLGSPTVLGGMHPHIQPAFTLLKAIRPRVKLAAFFGSCGWGGGAATQAKTLLETGGFEVADVLEIRGLPTLQDLDRASELGRKIARKIKELLPAPDHAGK